MRWGEVGGDGVGWSVGLEGWSGVGWGVVGWGWKVG